MTLASGAPLTALFTGTSKFVSTFFPQGDTLEKTFQKLAKIIADEDRRFLVVIDDIGLTSIRHSISVILFRVMAMCDLGQRVSIGKIVKIGHGIGQGLSPIEKS